MKTVPVDIIDDSDEESLESFEFWLESPENGQLGDSFALGTIVDDDAALMENPLIKVDDTIVNESSGSVTIPVRLSAPSDSSISLSYSTSEGTANSGSDYESISQSEINFAPGDTSETITVNLYDDTEEENEEDFFVQFSDPTAGSLVNESSEVVIASNDGETLSNPTISVDDIQVSEDDGVAEFVLRLNGPSNNSVSVTCYTSTSTASTFSDIEDIDRTVTFAPGETVKTVPVDIIDDSDEESLESFEFWLESPENGQLGDSFALGTIVDDDAQSTSSNTFINSSEFKHLTKNKASSKAHVH